MSLSENELVSMFKQVAVAVEVVGCGCG